MVPHFTSLAMISFHYPHHSTAVKPDIKGTSAYLPVGTNGNSWVGRVPPLDSHNEVKDLS